MAAVLFHHVRVLQERLAKVEEDLQDAWIVMIPHHLEHEWPWPDREETRGP
jgi:hypothetical protein